MAAQYTDWGNISGANGQDDEEVKGGNDGSIEIEGKKENPIY